MGGCHCVGAWLRPLYFCVHQVHAGVEIKLGRREGGNEEEKKQVKPDPPGSVGIWGALSRHAANLAYVCVCIIEFLAGEL